MVFQNPVCSALPAESLHTQPAAARPAPKLGSTFAQDASAQILEHRLALNSHTHVASQAQATQVGAAA